MKRLAFVVVIAAWPVLGGQFEKIFAGGLSLGLGSSGEGLSPGFNLALTGITKPAPYFGIGGRLGYDRWSIPTPHSLITGDRGSLHFIETSVVPRGILPVDRNLRFFAEACPGLFISVARSYTDPPRSNVDAHFGMSFALGMDLRRFEVTPRYKMIFSEGRVSRRWFELSAGFVFR